ncbi:MAG: methyltransferase [Deltaproteobacteria bacterium]|nr:methyltransferase [Deltaproteobacteria bacterium]MBW2390272.1 methyltransferase [Deltaproteobacteria bacterium]MBW2726711.1 methyltransferase [Deltaproteobacteria bacterium]
MTKNSRKSTEKTTSRPDTVRLQRISKAFWESAAFLSAIELNTFTAISEGNDSIESAARAMKIEPISAERLLTVLTAMELLERDADTFSNAPDVERFLVRGKPTYAGPWMLFAKPDWRKWGKLTEHLKASKEDQRRLGMYDETFTIERARKYHEATYSIGMGAARRFHRQVDLSGRRKLIDLGGGSGCYCIVAAKTYPELTAEVLDLAPVVAVTREYLEENGVADRVTATPCDFTTDALPTDADVAIMASNLPQYGREIIADVVARVHDALLPGGEFHLIGEMSDSDGRGPLAPALWGLAEALSHSTGLAHSVSDCVGYFEAAGFTTNSVHEFIPNTLTRVTGIKS